MIRPMYLPVEEYNRGVRGGAFAAIPIYLCKKSRVREPRTRLFLQHIRLVRFDLAEFFKT